MELLGKLCGCSNADVGINKSEVSISNESHKISRVLSLGITELVRYFAYHELMVLVGIPVLSLSNL